MKWLYDDLSQQVSKITTQKYSTSFSLGIRFLHPCLRKGIYSIYGFVRVADEIVDSFEGYDKQYLLSKFRTDCFEAIENKISCNPILHSFQDCVHQYDINLQFVETFLDSMKMDLEKIDYTQEKYKEYILGSAEVVGLMCLHVFTNGNKELFLDLKPYAMRLGAAFQKVNFLRDMKDDYHILGRVYFPGVDLSEFTGTVKKQIEEEIEADFSNALLGIKQLPHTSKGGVYLAYVYYYSLFKKIKKVPAHQILNERIRINDGRKIGLMCNSFVQYKMNWV